MLKKYKWRIVVGLSIAFAIALSVTLTLIFSSGKDKSRVIANEVSATAKESSEYVSINGVVTDSNQNLYLSDYTKGAVYKVDANGEVIKTYSADAEVNALSVDADGNVYALIGSLGGKVIKLNDQLDKVAEVTVGHTPEDIVFKDGMGYVANRFSNTVSVINLSSMILENTIAVSGREPNSLVVVENDLFVGSHLANDGTDGKLCSKVCVIDTTTNTESSVIELENGASSLKDICLSNDGKTVYAVHLIERYAFPMTHLDRGWVQTNGFSVIDVESKSLTCTVLLDQVDKGAGNPYGITTSEDGKCIIVSIAGTNEIALVDSAKLDERIALVKNGEHKNVASLDKIVDYIPFLDDAIEKVSVGVGARDIYACDGKVYCGLYFDGGVDVLDIASRRVDRLITFTNPENDQMRMGEILFNDSTICYQQWMSCSSCHPSGRVDGLNWDILGDGLGNPVNVKSHVYSHRTPPVGHNGGAPTAEDDVYGSMRSELFNMLSEDDIVCVDEYMKSLYPTLSPYLNDDGSLTESALEGEEIFNQNCASCHIAPLYTDMKKHEIDGMLLDTPTLIEVWRTAPYTHDGSLKTIEEVVRKFAPNLTEEEVKKVADFVRTIGANGEDYGVEQINMNKEGNSSYNIYKEGYSITSFTLRKQNMSAVDAVVTLSVFNQDGTLYKTTTANIVNAMFNVKYMVVLDEAIILPNCGKIEIKIADGSGNLIATTLVIE